MSTKLVEEPSILESWFGAPYADDEFGARYYLGGVEGMEELIAHTDGSFSYVEGGSSYPLPRLVVPMLAEHLLTSRLGALQANLSHLEKEASEAESRRAILEKEASEAESQRALVEGLLWEAHDSIGPLLEGIRELAPIWNSGPSKAVDTPSEEV